MKQTNQITKEIIGKSIEVHKTLGPGLLESVYQKCLCYELKESGFYIEPEKEIPAYY